MTGWDTPTTFAAVWAHAVATRSADTFLVFEGPYGHVAEWTYGEFDSQVGRVATTMSRLGVGSGDAVHLALTNSPSFVAIWLAATRMGAWIVPSDPMAKTPELADHIDRTVPAVGFCANSRAIAYRHAAPPDLPIIEIDEADVDFAAFDKAEFANWEIPDLTDRAAVMFTSGTTGRPKGVEITQANYAFAGEVMARAAGLTASDRHLVVLPLFHANAQYYSFASAISVGASVALMHTFSASKFLHQARRHKATAASLFAAPIRMILARAEPMDGVALRHCWFAQNLSADQYETFSSWIGCRPRQLYGMTETVPAVLTDHDDDPVPSSMGFVTNGCAVAVQDQDGQDVAAGDVGEIVVGGQRGLTLFAGYLDDRATTAASFRNDWFLTGDRARRDNDGRYFFDGRRSDVLKVAGENVSTVEVEAVLASHPGVLEASVVGAPDDIRDEVPVAFVVPRDLAAPPAVEELQGWCLERLGKAKQPRDITFLEELPRTSVGKIRKFMLTKGAQTP